jgi:hypothetical protein
MSRRKRNEEASRRSMKLSAAPVDGHSSLEEYLRPAKVISMGPANESPPPCPRFLRCFTGR